MNVALSLVVALSTVASVHASSISWSSPTNITGDTDVSTAGSLVAAFDFGDSPTTVNGVLFSTFLATPSSPPPNFTSLANGNFGLTAGANPIFPGPANYFGSARLDGSHPIGAFAALSPSYQSLLGSAFSAQSPFTLTINGLSVGSTYEFQWWTNSSRIERQLVSATAGNTVTLDANTAHINLLGVGQFAIGAFIADSSSQTIQFGPDDFLNGNFPVLNGLQLRDLEGQPTPTPGPSSTPGPTSTPAPTSTPVLSPTPGSSPPLAVPDTGSTWQLLAVALACILAIQRSRFARRPLSRAIAKH